MLSAPQIIDAFKSAMRESGIEPPSIITADGVLHRFHISGHKSGTLNGAYKLHMTGVKPAGYFEDFKSGIKTNWKANGPAKPLTQADRQQIEASKRQAAQQLRNKQLRTADTANRLWHGAKPVEGRNHPYLERKKVSAHGLRILPAWTKRIKQGDDWINIVIKNVLLVPLTDIDGKLWNLQAIFAEPHPELSRNKDFLSAGRVGGLFYRIGPDTDDKIVCEGAATGLTLYDSTCQQVYCAMSAGNLLAVAQLLRRAYPISTLTIAADNDAATPNNPGLTAARAAALAVDGLLAVPDMPGDFNDLYLAMEAQSHE